MWSVCTKLDKTEVNDDMQVQIDGFRTIKFSPQAISYVLDALASCPWKMANPIIMDIMNQLQAQAVVGEQNAGPSTS